MPIIIIVFTNSYCKKLKFEAYDLILPLNYLVDFFKYE